MGNTQEELLQRYADWLRIKRGNNEVTIHTSLSVLKQFLNWLQENMIELDDIDQDSVDNYLLYATKKYTKNSLVPLTITLRKFMQFLDKPVDVKVVHPCAPSREKTAFSKQEIRAMFEATKDNPLEHAIVKLLYYGGMRKCELIGLNINDVDFDRLEIVIHHGKGDKYRIINITQDCAMAIQNYLKVRLRPKEGHEKALLISSQRRRITGYAVHQMLKRIGARAGITKNVYCHRFRITHITHLAEAGLSPREIQLQSGHSDVSTLVGYIQHTPRRIRLSYDATFEDMSSQKPNIEPHQHLHPTTNRQYQEIVMKKYLDGEIDIDTLHSILSTLEEKQPKRKSHDFAYR